MNRRIQLTEYVPTSLQLNPADIDALLVMTEGRFDVRYTSNAGVVEVNPQQHVGILKLPSGTVIDVLPKVPLLTVLWMIAEVAQLDSSDFAKLDDTVDVRTFDEILEPVVIAFTDQMEHLIDRGLYRAYMSLEDNLTSIRGRIDFRQNLIHNQILQHRIWCRYSELSWDVPENQVFRQVLRRLAHWGFSPSTTATCVALERQLDSISVGKMIASDIDRFTYTRQNMHYRVPHRYCQLFLDGFSLMERAGDTPLDGFLINMNALFERFIAVRLEQALPQVDAAIRLRQQSGTWLDSGHHVPVIPDLAVERLGRIIAIADTKYKKLASTEHKNADLYQMISYCTALGIESGMLIYPLHQAEIHSTLEVQNSPIRIQEVTIDLSTSRQKVADSIRDLASHLVKSGTPVPVA